MIERTMIVWGTDAPNLSDLRLPPGFEPAGAPHVVAGPDEDGDLAWEIRLRPSEYAIRLGVEAAAMLATGRTRKAALDMIRKAVGDAYDERWARVLYDGDAGYGVFDDPGLQALVDALYAYLVERGRVERLFHPTTASKARVVQEYLHEYALRATAMPVLRSVR